MPSIRQIITDWTTASGAGKVSVMYFDAAELVDEQRDALADFWGTVDGTLDSSASWAIRTDGVELLDSSGTLTGVWTEATAHSGVGAGNDQPVADAVQVLVQWKAPVIVNGRILAGRTFVPGLGQLNTTDGNLGAAYKTVIQGAVNGLIASSKGFGVWHRPIAGSGGQFTVATTGTVWDELAVLRRRRS